MGTTIAIVTLWGVPALPNPVGLVRGAVGDAVRLTLAGRSTRSADDFVHQGSDPGLFGPDSVTWQVHGTPAMIIGGLRALFLQTLHPLALAGVADHSNYRHDPLGRLHRTSDFVGVTTYGTTRRAEEALATVRAVHQRVQGTTPGGRPYSALDPHLICWVHVTEVDSFLAAHQRYATGPTLTPEDADRYLAEMARIPVALGADPAEVPRSVDELCAFLDGIRPELRYGAQARSAVRFLVVPPLPLVTRGPYGVVAAAALGLLPSWARRMLWLPPVAVADPIVVRPAASAMVRALEWFLDPPPSSPAARLNALADNAAHG